MRNRRTLRSIALVAVIALGGLLPAAVVASTASADQNESTASLNSGTTANLERRITAGGLHTCALLDSGAVQCWGANSEGELGNGSTVASTVPVSVSGVTTAEDVTAGETHTCALMHGGTVECWGNNGNGQLGNGTFSGGLTPVTVTGLTGVTALAVGGFHSCAIVTDGTVRCWGSDGSGQLGDGGSGYSPVPVTVQGITSANKAVSIAAGEFFTCALLADSTVDCWGHNGFGQLGNNSTTDSSTPVVVSNLPPTGQKVLFIALGANHACAGIDDGTVRCWGSDFYGQLGDGNSGSGTDQKTPVTVSTIGSGNPPDALTAGADHTCALLHDQTVWCWGNNNRGQLGADPDPLTTKLEDSSKPIKDKAISGVSAITAGGFHTCALVSGSMVCWGYDFYGQLGSYVGQSLTPVEVTDIRQALTVTAGTEFACALIGDGTTTSQPKCWGSNANGRLGSGSTVAQSTIPLAVSGVTKATSIDAGNGHACLLPAGSSDPQCWGRGGNGQLGNNSTSDSGTPVTVAGLTTSTQVDAGGELVSSTEVGHTCSANTGGTVQCWGRNSNGQLGNNSTSDSSTPVTVLQANSSPPPATSGNLAGASEVAAGGLHSCALVSGGNVWCWGSNSNGQLGNNSTSDVHFAVQTHNVSGATRVVAGASHSCALMGDGSVKCWGANGSGQLGDGTNTDRHEPVTVKNIPNLLGKGAIALTAGHNHTCAELADDSVVCWGANGDGQLGNGSLSASNVPVGAVAGVPDSVSSAENVVTSLSAGRRNTCISLIDSSVECWGDNSKGQLGDGIGGTSLAPRAVMQLAGTLNGNHLPNPVDDTATTTPGTPVTVNVLANDTDPDGTPLTIVAVSTPPHGTTSLSSPNITYTPDAGYCGHDTFTYTVSDGIAQVPATVTILMNCAPTPQPDNVTTSEDTPVALHVLSNDTDPDNDPLTVVGNDTPAHGTVTLAADGTGTYTPVQYYCGPDTFGYTVSDGHNHTASTSVNITITCVNDPPVAGADTASTSQGTPVDIHVLANDTDPDIGETLSVSSVGSPQHGTATLGSGGVVTYTPASAFCGPDSFTYVVTDGTLNATGNVSVSVTCANQGPHAAADTANTLEDTAVLVPVLTNDTDSTPNATLTLAGVTTPANGTTSVSGTQALYTPNHNFCGTDTFGYQVSDGTYVDSGTVTVTVACVNDPPQPVDDVVSTAEDTPITIDVVANDTDPDIGDVVTLAGVGSPAHGTAVMSSGKVKYSPAPNYNGPDSFTYTATDGHGGNATGTVFVTVTPVDDPPVIHAVPNQTAPWGTDLMVPLSADDIDGPALTYSLVSGPPTASVTPGGLFEWVPDATDVGSVPITVQVSDGTYTSQTTFTVTVVRRTPHLVWSGPTSAQHSDPVIVAATLTDNGPLAFEPIGFTVGALPSTAGTTDSTGLASGVVTLTTPAGQVTATAAFPGDPYYAPVSVNVPFTITKEAVTVAFTGQFLTLISGTTAPGVPLAATVVQDPDGSLGTDLGTASVTFAQPGVGVLCTAPVVPASGNASGTATCMTAALAPGSRPVIVSVGGPNYAGPADVSVFTVAVAASGTASGAGQVGSGAGRADFGFQAAAAKKGATGDAVQIFRSGGSATIVQTTALTSLTISCSTGKTKVCGATVQGGSASTTLVDLATGAVGPPSGTSAIRVDATDVAEPVAGSVPPDTYAVGITGSTTYSLGSPTSQQLLSAGNIRVLS